MTGEGEAPAHRPSKPPSVTAPNRSRSIPWRLVWTVLLGLWTIWLAYTDRMLEQRRLGLEARRQLVERTVQSQKYRSQYLRKAIGAFEIHDALQRLRGDSTKRADLMSLRRRDWVVQRELKDLTITIANLEGRTFEEVIRELEATPSDSL